jgi:hypothetical protein
MNDLKTIFMLIGVLIVALGTIAATFGFIIWFDNYNNCIKENPDKISCLENFFREAPPVKEAENLAETCKESDYKCLEEIGKKVISKKIEDKVTS